MDDSGGERAKDEAQAGKQPTNQHRDAAAPAVADQAGNRTCRERVRLVMRLEIGPARRGREESFIFTAVWVGR